MFGATLEDIREYHGRLPFVLYSSSYTPWLDQPACCAPTPLTFTLLQVGGVGAGVVGAAVGIGVVGAGVGMSVGAVGCCVGCELGTPVGEPDGA